MVMQDSCRVYKLLKFNVLRLEDPALTAVSNQTLLQVLQGRIAGVNMTEAEPNIVV